MVYEKQNRRSGLCYVFFPDGESGGQRLQGDMLVNDAAVLEKFHGEKHGLQPADTDYSVEIS